MLSEELVKQQLKLQNERYIKLKKFANVGPDRHFTYRFGP